MSQSVRPSVFGNVHLGYIVIETQKFSDWRRFGRDAIGMHLDDRSPDTMRGRISRSLRIVTCEVSNFAASSVTRTRP